MARSFQTIKPIDIIDAFEAKKDLWDEFKTPSVKVIADGTRTLEGIWRGAWNAGNGNSIASTKLVTAKTKALMTLYEDTKFIPSLKLSEIKAILKN